MIGCLGGDFSAAGLLLFQVPAGDVTHVRRVVHVLAEILDHAEEMPHPVVGQPRLVAASPGSIDRP